MYSTFSVGQFTEGDFENKAASREKGSRMLLRDNVPVHYVVTVKRFVAIRGVVDIGHHSCPSDLGLTGYCLFPE
jgi:hypothetical protein